MINTMNSWRRELPVIILVLIYLVSSAFPNLIVTEKAQASNDEYEFRNKDGMSTFVAARRTNPDELVLIGEVEACEFFLTGCQSRGKKIRVTITAELSKKDVKAKLYRNDYYDEWIYRPASDVKLELLATSAGDKGSVEIFNSGKGIKVTGTDSTPYQFDYANSQGELADELPIRVLKTAGATYYRISDNPSLGDNNTLNPPSYTNPSSALLTYLDLEKQDSILAKSYNQSTGSEGQATPTGFEQLNIIKCLLDKGDLKNIAISEYSSGTGHPIISLPSNTDCNFAGGSAALVAYGFWLDGRWGGATLIEGLKDKVKLVISPITFLDSLSLNIAEFINDKDNNIIFIFSGYEQIDKVLFYCDIQGDCRVLFRDLEEWEDTIGSYTSEDVSIEDKGYLSLLINRVFMPAGNPCSSPVPYPNSTDPPYTMEQLHSNRPNVKECLYTGPDGWLAKWGIKDVSGANDSCKITNIVAAGGIAESTRLLSQCLVDAILTPMLDWVSRQVQEAAGLSLRTPLQERYVTIFPLKTNPLAAQIRQCV